MINVFFALSLRILFNLNFAWAQSITPNGVQVTQSLSMKYNTQIPANMLNSTIYLKQYFLPLSWANIEADPEVLSQWSHYVLDTQHPGMVRVLIHPYDTASSKNIEAVLRKYNLQIKSDFFPVPLKLSESRSLFPSNIFNGEIPASPKLSITEGLGAWNGKETERTDYGNEEVTLTKLISRERAEFALLVSRLIQQKLRGTIGNYFELQPERMILTIVSPNKELNLGETFRDISSLIRPGEYNVPSFVGQDPYGGILLALANGETSHYDYLKNIEAPLRGRALAEFFIRTGFVHSSPHSQNFLIVTDRQFRALGRLGIRDLPDLIPTYDSRIKDTTTAKLFNDYKESRPALQKNLDGGEDYFVFRHSFAKGNKDISQITLTQKIELEKEVTNYFIKTLSIASGVSENRIRSIVAEDYTDVVGDYATTFFKRDTDVWTEVISNINSKTNMLPNLAQTVQTRTREQSRLMKQQILKIITKKLQGYKLNFQEQSFITSFLHITDEQQLNPEERHFVIQAILGLEIIPKGYIENFMKLLQTSGERSLLFKTIKQRGDLDDKIEVLKYTIKNSNVLKSSKNFQERIALNELIKELIWEFESDLSKNSQVSIKYFELLYFALDSTTDPNDRLSNFILFWKIATKAKGIPESIRLEILHWKDLHGHSYILEPLLNSGTLFKVNQCQKIFSVKLIK